MFDFRCGRMRKKARCFRSRAIRGAGIGSINVFRSGFRLIRTLGPLIAVALAGSSLSAETAPTPHSNRAAPISAELAKTCRALAIKHTPRNQRVAGLPLDRLDGTISKSA
jgi:hypothetical protein